MEQQKHNQETIIVAIQKIFADLLSAKTNENISREYYEKVADALYEAYVIAVQNDPRNKR